MNPPWRPVSRSHRRRALAASSFAWAKCASPGPRFHAKCAWISRDIVWEKTGDFTKPRDPILGHWTWWYEYVYKYIYIYIMGTFWDRMGYVFFKKIKKYEMGVCENGRFTINKQQFEGANDDKPSNCQPNSGVSSFQTKGKPCCCSVLVVFV